MRVALRLARVGLHLGYGLATAALVYPAIGRPARLKLKQRWSRQLLGMLGVRLSIDAAMPASPALLVANHVSWLDIYVINALAPAAFVCKAEVRDWPLIGWLCERTETVFMPRGSRSAAKQAGEIVALRLRQGWRVGVFPEGTTTDGSGLLPFHAALLQGAIDADCLVQPLALRYLDERGQATAAAAYCGDTTLLQSLCRIAALPCLEVRLDVLPPLDGRGAERRRLAAQAEMAIGRALNRPLRDGGARVGAADGRVSLAAT
ncbi:MAG: lysophospholipid acyltransferase family protein [Denitratisoma sp.]|nr:lysophospholipid acyltransferase family protein [Denitratisoma sp.]